MICSVCKEDRDTTEVIVRDGTTYEPPKKYCDECLEERDMKELLCEKCFIKWESYR